MAKKKTATTKRKYTRKAVKFPTQRQTKFLKAVEEVGTVRGASSKSGIPHQTHYNWMKECEGYPAAFEAAKKICREKAVECLWTQGFEGRKRKKFTGKGEPILDPETGEQYHEVVYSEKAKELFVRIMFPEIYASRDVKLDANHQHSIPQGVQIYLPDNQRGAE